MDATSVDAAFALAFPKRVAKLSPEVRSGSGDVQTTKSFRKPGTSTIRPSVYVRVTSMDGEAATMTSHSQSRPRPLNGGLVVPRGTAPDLIAAVRLAETRGVESVWTTVGGASSDPVTSFAAVASQT